MIVASRYRLWIESPISIPASDNASFFILRYPRGLAMPAAAPSGEKGRLRWVFASAA
jgi:hypothetical protein